MDDKQDMSQVNHEEIVNLLTLRYHPIANTLLPRRNWKDFIEKDHSMNEALVKLENILLKTIENIQTKKLGVAFSGGLDSTTILWLAKQYKANIMTFSMVEDAEDKSIETISNKFDVEHHNIVVTNVLERLPEQIYILGKPRWNLYSYYVFDYASKHCDVMFTGDGGDEIFGGYTFRYQRVLNEDPKNLLDKIKIYLNAHERDWVPDQELIFGSAINFKWNTIYSKFNEYFDNPLPLIDQLFLADFNGKLLYDWLPVYYKWSEALNITTYSPFLEKMLIDFATHMPYKLKYDHTTKKGKLILRKFLSMKNIPQNITEQNKSGFVVDTVKLWKNYGRMVFEELMDKSRIVTDGLINKEWIDKTLHSEFRLNSPRYINKLLGILALEIWYRIFVINDMKRSERL